MLSCLCNQLQELERYPRTGPDKMGRCKQSRESGQAGVDPRRGEATWEEPGRLGDHRQVTVLGGGSTVPAGCRGFLKITHSTEHSLRRPILGL